jgi:hypothetical protein
MVVVTPGGFENVFPTIALCKPETPARTASVATDFGLPLRPDDDRKVA